MHPTRTVRGTESMKLIILAVSIFSFLLTSAAVDAASCKYEQNEIDSFTKEKIVTTKWISMSNVLGRAFKKMADQQKKIAVAATRDGDENFITFKINMSRSTPYRPSQSKLRNALWIPRESRLTVTMSDESMTDIFTVKDARGDTHSSYDDSSYLIATGIIVQFQLDDDEFSELTEQGISHLEFEANSGGAGFSNDGSLTFKVGRKGRDALQRALNCVDQA